MFYKMFPAILIIAITLLCQLAFYQVIPCNQGPSTNEVMMKVAVLGTGYVGLVTGTCLAEMGNEVICVDIDEKKITLLNQGILPFFEPGLPEKVFSNKKANRLVFTSSYEQAILNADVVFIAVPTPSNPDGSANLEYIKKASMSLAPYLRNYTVIANKSTAPVGTVEQIKHWINSVPKDPNASFDVISNPEFLRQGSAVNDFMKPSRIIIGSCSEKASGIMQDLYAPFMFSHNRTIIMDPKSSEMTKYAANAMLATKISFMNDLSSLCETMDVDITCVRHGMGSDERIGYQCLYPGIGYGGSCFPKDIKALESMGDENNASLSIVKAVDDVNERQKRHLTKKICHYFKTEDLKGKTFALWGISFKPETDDLRCAPALVLIEELLQRGAVLRLFDPAALSNVKKLLGNDPRLFYAEDVEECSLEVDAIILATDWKQFRFLDLQKILATMKGQAFFDGRNQYDPKEMQLKGFDYISIGRSDVKAYSRKVEDAHSFIDN